MKSYIGTKQVKAMPETKNGKEGYKVVYPDGYESWSPKAVFEAAYRESGNMTFGHAVELMKQGHRVARKGWNGKGMWLGLVVESNYVVQMPVGAEEDTAEGEVKGLLPWIGMKTADNKFVPWLASQTDVLAEDWVLV